jgi:hypothetical protein
MHRVLSQAPKKASIEVGEEGEEGEVEGEEEFFGGSGHRTLASRN